MSKNIHNPQQGAVSIFVVVFSALFVTIITVSFVSIMIRAQQQATNADLSNSAYDAALAGVEDAKRVLLKYRKCLRDSTPSECTSILNLFNDPNCNMVRKAITGETNSDEMLIQAASGDSSSQALDQAYTCVILGYTAESKELQVRDGESMLIPIESAGQPYNKVSISWFTKDPAAGLNLTLPDVASGDPDSVIELPTKTEWMAVGSGNTIPPLLRAQWIQHGGSFNVSDFESDKTEGSDITANTKTVFLYPSTAGLPSYNLNTIDDRNATTPAIKAPVTVTCSNDQYELYGGYACSVDLELPKTVGSSGTRTGYLQLGALYNSTKVKVMLKNDSAPVPIVAPTIDATGRANDLFRRIKVGISFTGEYPRANLDINGNLCKDFSVTNDEDGYIQGGCNPDNPNNL